MGREVKRVSVDFDWPLHKVWPGFCYETPDCGITTCPDAEGSALPWSKDAMCTFHRALWDGDYPKFEPPAGDGWQLWETVSEGSPISPVFATRDEFVRWLSTEYHMVGGGQMTREQADAFAESGWAPSFIFSAATGLVPGEQFAGDPS